MSDILNINPLIYTHQTEVNENPETKTETSLIIQILYAPHVGA
jgi:hypothetical protein